MPDGFGAGVAGWACHEIYDRTKGAARFDFEAQQLIPHAFPVKGQAQGLAGDLAIELMCLLNGGADA